MATSASPLSSSYPPWLLDLAQKTGVSPDQLQAMGSMQMDPMSAGGGGGGGGTGTASFPNAPSPYTPTSNNGSDFTNLVSGDPNKIQRQVISNVLGQGNTLMGGDAAQQNYYGGLESTAYGNVQNQYAPIWAGGGGYTPGEQSNILQQGGPTGTANLQQEVTNGLSNDYLSPSAQQSIIGDPYRAQRTAEGDTSQLKDTSSSEAALQRSIASGGTSALGQDVSKMAAGYSAAIDPSVLSASSGYFEGQNAALTGGAGSMGAALANPDLNVTDQYKKEAGMTDQEVANTAALGAEAAGAGYQADEDALQQAAEASGETNPLAVAAMRDQLQRESGAAVTDATVRAQLQARAQQRAAATGVQQTELGAGQYKTGAELNTAEQLMNAQLASGQAQENTRLGAAQDISGREMTAAGDVGLAAIGTGEFGIGQEAGTEANIANRQTQIGEYATGQDVATAQAGEAALANRQNELALNRQSTNIYNQATQFNQGMGVNSLLSNRYNTIANMHQANLQEGRQAATGVMSYEGNQANQAGARENQAYATQTSGLTGTSSSYDQSKNQQSANGFFGSNGMFGRMASAAIGGASGGGFGFGGGGGGGGGGFSLDMSPATSGGYAEGGIVTTPTHLDLADGSEALVGEGKDNHFATGYAPEAIVPLTDPHYEPMMEQVRRARAAIKGRRAA